MNPVMRPMRIIPPSLKPSVTWTCASAKAANTAIIKEAASRLTEYGSSECYHPRSVFSPAPTAAATATRIKGSNTIK